MIILEYHLEISYFILRHSCKQYMEIYLENSGKEAYM